MKNLKIIVASFVLVSGSAHADLSVIDLGITGPGPSSINVFDVNNNGQVVGYISQGGMIYNSTAFVWQNGSFTYLQSMGGGSAAISINSNGDVVGNTESSPYGPINGYVWQNNAGTYTPQAIVTGWGNVQPRAINDNGMIVNSYPGSIWNQASGATTYLPYDFMQPYAINNLGQVAGANTNGNMAMLWDGNSATYIGNGYATSINDKAQVVVNASAYNPNTPWVAGYHSSLWENGSLSDIGSFGGSLTFGNDINNKSEIVGSSSKSNGDQHAFLVDHGVMIDLNSMLNTQDQQNWVLNGAVAISDTGYIVGYGTLNGQLHDFVLAPIVPPATVPEPATYAIILAGLGAMNGIARRRKANLQV